MQSPTTEGPPARRRALHAFVWIVLVLALVLASVGAALSWLVLTEGGNAWLLARLPGVLVKSPQGRLLGDFDAERIEAQLPGGDRLIVDGLRWRDLQLRRSHAPDQWLSIRLGELQVRRVELHLADKPPSAPAAPPTSLRLPFEFELRSLRIGELHTGALGERPLRDLRARLHLGAEAGAVHRVDELALGWGRLQASGSARIATAAPLTLAAQVALAQDASADFAAWNASGTLAGTLAAPALQATLRATPSPTRAAQSLDLTATLLPFEPWPLGDLRAAVQGLDLSAFHPAAPVTALSGEATARTAGLDLPAELMLRLGNAQAGRWDEARLPVRHLSADVRGRPDDPGKLELQRLDVELGTQALSAGQVQGEGHWTPDRWSLDARLKAVQPTQLDARAPVMRLDGPLSLIGSGFASTAANAQSIEVKTDLTGQLTGATLGTQVNRRQEREVQLKLDAMLNALRVELRELQARSAGARASLAGNLARPSSRAAWRLSAQADLVDFDPSPWWPGRVDSPWRKGPHRLNAKATMDLGLPAADTPARWAEQLAALRGKASLTISDSLLAGVPLKGEVRLSSLDGAMAMPSASIDITGNRVSAEGRISTQLLPSGAAGRKVGNEDQWQLAIDAPALDRLAPLFRLLAAPGIDDRVAGAVKAKAVVTGRWPDLRTEGEIDASALRVGEGGVQRAQGRWQLGTAADAVMEAQATVTSPAWGDRSLESVQLLVKGTGRAHSIELNVASKLLPPAWVDVVQAQTKGTSGNADAAAGQARSLALLRAEGGWLEQAGQARAGWRGKLERLEWLGSETGAAPWLRARDLGIEASWAGGPARVTLQPGRVELLGGALRWTRLAWQEASAGATGQIDVQAEIEPIRVAPILSRLQANFGWGGDLSVGGVIRLRSAPDFVADVVIERKSGDLSVTDETGTQALGLSDLRLALDARDGVWNFTQGLAGKTLGVGAGAVVVRTTPQALWPGADAAISGVLELQVANLGTWGTWVPAGWRLGGELRTSASIAGTFGAPEYTGEMRGRGLSVRNFLEGVNVSDGELALLLQGETARIEKFTLSAGAGRMALEGSASFGAMPQALLMLRAERFQLLGRVDRRIITSGQAQLQIDRDTLTLNGEFGVDEALIDFTRSDAPSLSDDVEVVRAKASKPGAVAAEPGSAPAQKRKVDLDLRVALGDQLRLRGRGLDTLLRGSLRITAPGNRLAVNGTVSAAEGKYAAYGQKLAIDRSAIIFNGPVENPRLDIEAIRPDLEVRVGVAITGTAVNPRIRLFSVPEMSEKDKLSWLLLGRASDTLGGTETALLQRAAVALLSGEEEGKTDQIIRAIGLDQFSVRQSDGEVRETVVSLGKQISRRWYVGYERSLNATAGNWQLIYRIARSFTLRAQAGLDNSFDAIWSWRW
jgi:translocation and assembly module TamB